MRRSTRAERREKRRSCTSAPRAPAGAARAQGAPRTQSPPAATSASAVQLFPEERERLFPGVVGGLGVVYLRTRIVEERVLRVRITVELVPLAGSRQLPVELRDDRRRHERVVSREHAKHGRLKRAE